MDNKKKIDDLIEILDEIKSLNLLVIVEGKKDISSLRKFGINSVSLKGSLTGFCEKTAELNNEVILLLDNDKQGKKLALALSKNLEILGVKANKKYMSLLRSLGISHIEGISRFIKRRI